MDALGMTSYLWIPGMDLTLSVLQLSQLDTPLITDSKFLAAHCRLHSYSYSPLNAYDATQTIKITRTMAFLRPAPLFPLRQVLPVRDSTWCGLSPSTTNDDPGFYYPSIDISYVFVRRTFKLLGCFESSITEKGCNQASWFHTSGQRSN
jgi:hypothetical protein